MGLNDLFKFIDNRSFQHTSLFFLTTHSVSSEELREARDPSSLGSLEKHHGGSEIEKKKFFFKVLIIYLERVRERMQVGRGAEGKEYRESQADF